MQKKLALNEAVVQEIKEEKEICRSKALQSFKDLEKLLNGSNEQDSEEREAAEALKTVAQV